MTFSCNFPILHGLVTTLATICIGVRSINDPDSTVYYYRDTTFCHLGPLVHKHCFVTTHYELGGPPNYYSEKVSRQ